MCRINHNSYAGMQGKYVLDDTATHRSNEDAHTHI